MFDVDGEEKAIGGHTMFYERGSWVWKRLGHVLYNQLQGGLEGTPRLTPAQHLEIQEL